jgi:hypothetical protein
MKITQNSISNFSVKLDIQLQDNYSSVDTVVIELGGLFFDEDGETFDAVENLIITSKQKIPFVFDRENKKIKICKNKIYKNRLLLKYDFNFIWNVSRDESSILFCNSQSYVEKPVPVIKNTDNIYISVKVKPFKNFICLTNIENPGIYSDINNVALCFVDTTLFTQKRFRTEFCNVNIFVNDSTLTKNNLDRLANKIKDCLEYFSKNISSYRFKNFNIIEVDWLASGSTYFGGIAYVYKSDIRTYTLFHELTHEWVGGQIKIKNNSKGEYLLKESLNDYLMTQFLRYEEGDSLYQVQIKNYIDLYNKYLTNNEDKSILDITKYVHSTHAIIMYKQVVLLDKLAQEVGYKKLNSVIFEFLKKSVGKEIETTQFLNLLKEEFGKPAINYCEKI